jgi:putative transposase
MQRLYHVDGDMVLFKNKYRIESTRLKGWDYRSTGYYFVTICTQNREHFFGEVADGIIRLSSIGETAARFWAEIPSHHTRVELDEFIVMPNHVHGIIVIVAAVETLPVETLRATSLRDPKMSAISPKAGSLSAIVRSYKSAVSRWAGENGIAFFEWQSRYYDHIIRDEKSFKQIRQYIIDNPVKWESDHENPANLFM